MPLTKEDIQVGKVYRAKRPAKGLDFSTFTTVYNDRTVLFVKNDSVQYDSIAVKNGQNYPTVSMEKFLKWASHEVVQE